MLHSNSRTKLYSTCELCAGPFGPLGRPKDMIERLEQNKSEQSRLMTAVKYNSKQKRVHSKFLLSRKNLFVHKFEIH